MQAAQALGKFGFYKEMTSDDTFVQVALPKELEEDLQVAFQTFAIGESGDSLSLPWSAVPKALMYVGIFEKPSDPDGVNLVNEGTRLLDEEQFVALGHDMLMAKLSEAQIEKVKNVFKRHAFDKSGVGVSELSLAVAEIHPSVNPEEIESMADAWAHDGGGYITMDSFIAIISRFVRKHQPDWNILSAFEEFLAADGETLAADEKCTDRHITAWMIEKKSRETAKPISYEEAKEMLWAASVTNINAEAAEISGIDFSNFVSFLFVYLDEAKGSPPPVPYGEEHMWPSPPELTTCDVESSDEDEDPTKDATNKRIEVIVGVDDAELSCRLRVYLFLEEPTSSREAHLFAFVMLLIILLSVAILFAEPLVSGPNQDEHSDMEKTIWKVSETVFSILFTFELLVRGCVASAPPEHTFCKWLVDPSTLIDIAAVLPYYTDIILASFGDSFKALRIIRMMRIGRVMRIARMGKLSGRVSKNKCSEILTPIAVVLVVIWGIYLKNSPDLK
jgi:hypothetical protein